MNDLQIRNMMVFLPAKDFQSSSRFYEDIGFTRTVSTGNAAQFVMQDHGFWLQDYYVEAWAANTMLCLYVEDIHAWALHLDSLDLVNRYGGAAKVLSAPHEQEGGVMMQFCDPAGVLWHVREAA
jgi:catechol 2,3-dioxygenase-like lactoylglutathione lyase family enzyme